MLKSIVCATVQTASSFHGYFACSERGIPNPAVRATIIKLYQETIMKKDQVKGRFKEAKGKVKEIAGKAVGNKDSERKGR